MTIDKGVIMRYSPFPSVIASPSAEGRGNLCFRLTLASGLDRHGTSSLAMTSTSNM